MQTYSIYLGNQMKEFIQRSMAVSVLFLLLASPVFGGWKADITQNQIRVKEYIAKLKNGEDPDDLVRPRLKFTKTWKGKQSRKEIAEAMNRAEELARSGKRKLIDEPVFEYNGLTEDRYRELKEKDKKSK